MIKLQKYIPLKLSKNIYFFISTFCTYQYLYFSIFVIVTPFFFTDAALENGQIMEHEI